MVPMNLHGKDVISHKVLCKKHHLNLLHKCSKLLKKNHLQKDKNKAISLTNILAALLKPKETKFKTSNTEIQCLYSSTHLG